MVLKFIFDRIVALVGLLVLWPVLLVVAIMVKVKMPGGPALFVQNRVGKDGKLFKCHKFRTMLVRNENQNENEKGGWSTVSVAGITVSRPLAQNYVITSWTSCLACGMCCEVR